MYPFLPSTSSLPVLKADKGKKDTANSPAVPHRNAQVKNNKQYAIGKCELANVNAEPSRSRFPTLTET